MKPERPTDAEAKLLFSSLMTSPMLEAKLLGEGASAQETEAVHSALSLAYTDWSKLDELAPDIRQAENEKLLPHIKNLESSLMIITAAPTTAAGWPMPASTWQMRWPMVMPRR